MNLVCLLRLILLLVFDVDVGDGFGLLFWCVLCCVDALCLCCCVVLYVCCCMSCVCL